MTDPPVPTISLGYHEARAIARRADRGGLAPLAGPMRCPLMPSTIIKRFDYSPERGELVVLFTTGRRYVYSGVPEEEAARFRAAFAKGVHFNRRIRGRYRFTEVEPDAVTS